MELSFFTLDGDDLIPTEVACSLWGKDHLHGVAVSGALARGLEQAVAELGRDELRPARYTVDLFSQARMAPSRVRTTVVRQGRRLVLVDAVFEQADGPVARATGLFVVAGERPDGAVWEPGHRYEIPPEELAPVSDEPRVPLFHSDSVGWSDDFTAHQNGDRKATWQTGLPVVAGEKPTPFVALAGIADATSMVTNWGSNGVEYINTDISLSLVRAPVSLEVGLVAVDRVSDEGVAVGTAAVHDREGPIGTAVVSSIANARRTVRFDEQDFPGARSSGA